ncbi:hypothetical protein HMPREF0972_01330 [Actinomyces sp. oral taxon 848 str. F0332]|nr:hypothetical protein HMPREF0972_01330 [Actinomyces sp. oral taxon 848 str. F0332]
MAAPASAAPLLAAGLRLDRPGASAPRHAIGKIPFEAGRGLSLGHDRPHFH